MSNEIYVKCCNTIAPVNNAGVWGSCDLRIGHEDGCKDFSLKVLKD